MKYAAIAIIGGGLTNSTAASMLGRAGIRAVLIDPHPVYPSDFRVKNSAAMTARTFLARSNRRIGAVVDGSR
jgi:2-polyprenyl-6-methoxyphenol hydroxylase-like FAD-dependent oxidoreductase